jgi:hypothetical protein
MDFFSEKNSLHKLAVCWHTWYERILLLSPLGVGDFQRDRQQALRTAFAGIGDRGRRASG